MIPGFEKVNEQLDALTVRGDLISRKAAIAQVSEDIWDDAVAHDVIELLKELPTAEPERKTGHWIEDAESYYRAVNDKGGGVNEDTPYFTDDIACSECLAMFSVIDNCTEAFNYCPNCGAKMEG